MGECNEFVSKKTENKMEWGLVKNKRIRRNKRIHRQNTAADSTILTL
jgi:hypothetical protein